MIKSYTGVPGSGKSLHAIRLILDFLKDGKNVIANFPINFNYLKNKEKKGTYLYLMNEEITVEFLYNYKFLYHKENEESQTLLILDEASVKFNCRTTQDKDRLSFLSFFSQHRKFGYTIVLISQNLKQIDRQIRDLVELEIIHRKLNNIKFFEYLPFSLFVAVEKNITVKEKNNHQFFLYNKRMGNLYNTFYDFTGTMDDNFKPNDKIIKKIDLELINMKKTEPLTPKGFKGPHGVKGSVFNISILKNKFNKLFKKDKFNKNIINNNTDIDILESIYNDKQLNKNKGDKKNNYVDKSDGISISADTGNIYYNY